MRLLLQQLWLNYIKQNKNWLIMSAVMFICAVLVAMFTRKGNFWRNWIQGMNKCFTSGMLVRERSTQFRNAISICLNALKWAVSELHFALGKINYVAKMFLFPNLHKTN